MTTLRDSGDRTEHRAVEPLHRTAWHAVSVGDVEARLDTGVAGLSVDEVAARLARFGPNRLREDRPPSALKTLVHQFRSPLIYILLVATAVTLVVGEYMDALVISAVLALNATLGFVQETQAEKSVRALMHLVAAKAHVVREGREQEVDGADVVPGDLVLLESGGRVPADVRLITSTTLTVDESLLTGESVPAAKHTAPVPEDAGLGDRTDLAFSGTIVATGRGRGYVVATGVDTELGRIAELVRSEEERETPLQHRMSRFARLIGLIVFVAAGGAVVIGVALGKDLAEMFMVGVALAVSAVPEALPVVFTITLALGVRRMAARRAIIRRLPAVETLGSTTVIGSDKTGTMTQNRMTVLEVWAGDVTWMIPEDQADGSSTPRSGPPEETPLRLTLLAGIMANEAALGPAAPDAEDAASGVAATPRVRHGDPTEIALLVAAESFGLDVDGLRAASPVIDEIPFEPVRQYSAAERELDGSRWTFVKGAPERLLLMCDRMVVADGTQPLDRPAIMAAAAAMAVRGLRVLAMAYVPPGEGPGADGHESAMLADMVVDGDHPQGLVFAGLQGMQDPPRAGVREAIAGCQEAGIRVVMITGDHADTARSIAVDLGLDVAGDGAVLTGAELDGVGDDELPGCARETSVFARVSPDQKLRIVRALQADGEVVAVTGDGVNDAPALKAADIGVAMGQSGTDVAREASDMVLTDDDFVSIYAAVEEGRVTFDNIRKVTFFLVSTGAAEIALILGTLLLGYPLALLPAQILWLNLVTNGLQDVALAFEPGEKDVLRRAPRRRDEDVMSPLLWERTLVAGLVMAVGTFAMFTWELDGGSSLGMAQTVALMTMVVFQMFHAGNCRSETRSLFRMDPFSNRFLLLAVVGAFAISVAALYLPVTQAILRVEPIGLEAWLRIIVVASTLLVAIELHKALRRRRPVGRRARLTGVNA